MEAPRIVLTGVGVVSPLGIGAEPFWDALVSGRSAIGPLQGLDPGAARVRLGAQVSALPARDYVPAAQLRRMDRLSQMIAVASVQAARHGGLAAERGEDLGLVVGSALGNMSESAQFLERAFTRPGLANPMLFPNLVLNAPASQAAIALGWRGPNLTVCEGEVSGEAALETAIGVLRRGRARAMIAAAGDELAAVVFRALDELGVLSPRRGSREWSSPFDQGATGPVMGEGAVALLLETEVRAAERGVGAIATIGFPGRLTLPVRSPHHWPAAAAALGSDGEPPFDVLICGADSSPERDRIEQSLLAGLGLGRPIHSCKGATGEYGSAGLLGVAVAALCVDRGVIPPLCALESPPADFGFVYPREARRGPWRRALVVGMARGGGGFRIAVGRPR